MQARPSSLRRRAAASMALVALLTGLTACANSAASTARSADSAGPTSGPDPATSGGSTQPTVMSATDRSACSSVQQVFLKLAGVSAQWDPVGDPFNAHMANALRPMAGQLRAQSHSASTTRFREVFNRNADALAALSAAIRSGQQSRVAAALAKSRDAYGALPRCARRGGGQRTHDAQSTQTQVPNGASSSPQTGGPAGGQTSVVRSAAKDPGCADVRAVYSKLGSITSGWDFEGDPYDATTAAGFRRTADGLDAASHAADSPTFAKEVEANGAAFRRLADAMAAKNLDGVNNGVISMQQTAATLAAACPLS